MQELTLVKEKLETEVGKLQVNIRLAKNTIRDFIIEKAYYPNSSKEKDKPGALRLNKDDLNDLDLSKVSIEEFRKRKAHFSQYGEYFKNGDKIQYASDLAGWIMGIKTNGGSEFLRRMSVAMMYELHMAQGYQNYSNFVPEEWTHTDEDGNTVTTYSPNPYAYFARTPVELYFYNLSPFLDASNGIHKSLRPTAAARSIQARTLIEVSKIRVFGLALGNRYSEEEAMERMLPRARSSWSAVKDTPEYHFFRLLMTIAAKDGDDPLPLRSNIANSAVQDHVIASMKLDGASYRSYLDPFWYWREHDSITNAMNNMPNHWHWNKINEFLQNGKLTKDMNEWRGYVKSLKALNEDTPTENSVKMAIKDREGTLNASVNAALQHELGKVIAAGKGGIVAVVTGARERVIDELADTDKRLNVRARELTRKAETLEKGYTGILARFLKGKATRTQLTQAAGERYRSLGFDTLGYLTGRTDNASGVRTHNTQGEAEKFTNLIERALAQAAYGDSAAHRKVRHAYDMDRKQLKRSLDERQVEITSLIKLARTEWSTSRTRLEGMRIRWRRDTKERYEDSSELWDLRHAQLAAGREKWLEESTRAGMIAGSRAVAVQWDIEAKTLIADAESAIIPSLSIDTPSLSKLVEDAAGGTVLDALIERAGRMTPRGSDTAMVVAAYLPSLNVNAAKASVARSITQSLFDQVTERAAVLTAIRARDQFDKQLAGMEKGIDDANENVEKMLANQMRAAGYRREGAIWRRQSVIGSTLFGGEEWEDQHVGIYRRFTSPGFRARTDLSNKALKGLSGAEIFTLVERASEEMTRYQVLIFGRSDEQRSEKTKDGKTNAKYVKPADADEFHKVLKAILKDSREAWKTSAGASRHSDTEGLFNFHVGYRPVMKGEEVSEAGYGQIGRIMSQFMTNEARMGRGHAALMTPDYRKPMWDDDADNDGKSDGIIAAPSLATVIDIAANIVIAAVLPGGVGNVILGAALNLVDDFIFATADVATGYATSDQAFGAFGKKALVSAATTVTGGLLNGFGSATAAGADKFLAGGLRGLVKTSSSLGRAAVNSGFAAATATVNKVMSRGIHVAVDGGSWEDFAEDFDSVSDWAGVAAATVQGGIGSLAGDFLTTDGTNWGLQENIFNTDALRGAASLTGNLSGALTEYAMSGRTSLNLLNMSMFNIESAKGGRLSGGLLQLNLGGGGNLFNIGQGGWSTSIDTIAAAMGGLDEIGRVSRAKIAGEGSHALGVLNMVNYQATGGDYRLARDIWNRNIKVAFEDLGRTAYGLYRHKKTPDTIVVNQRYNTNDREDAAVLASAGSHEGQHLYDRRDLGYTTEAGAHTRVRQTYMNLLEILELKGNRQLMDTIDAALADPRSGMANQGDVDYWKVMSNGDILFDGKHDLYDEDGNLLRRFEGGGTDFRASLAEHLGLTLEEAKGLMSDAGFIYDSKTKTYKDEKARNLLNNKNHIIDPGVDFAARYFIQRNYIDKVGKHHKDMVDRFYGNMYIAVDTAFNDSMMKLMETSGPIADEVQARIVAAKSMMSFAYLYDESVGNGWDYQIQYDLGYVRETTFRSHDKNKMRNAVRQIRDEWSQTNANPLYRFVKDGFLSPIVGYGGERLDVGKSRESGKPTYITTRAFYPYDNKFLNAQGLAGGPHGQNRGGLGIDMGTHRIRLPVVLTQPETILAQRSSVYYSGSLGNVVETETPLFRKLSAHLDNSSAYKSMNELMQSAMSAGIFRYELPTGYQIGNVGNTGASLDATHLHWEWIPKWNP